MPFPAVWGVEIFQNFLYAPRQRMVALRLDSVSSRIISVSDRRVAKELGKGVTTPFPWAFWEWSYVSSFTILLVFPYLYMVNRPGKCHFQPSGRDLGAKIFLRSPQPMVARSAESLSVGFFPLDKFLATLLLIGGIIMHLVSYDFSPRQSEDFSVCSHPRNTCSRHCIQAHFPMVSLLFKW